MERNCELCSRPARMYCESDEARLCWECDEKVHGANFLVAKHSRSLLCNVCQSPTPWKASGTKLSPTISVCEGCFDNGKYARSNPAATSSGRVTMTTRRRRYPDGEEEEDLDRESSAGSSGDDEDDEEEEDCSSDEDRDIREEEDGENQVVPWASCPSGPSPSASSAPPLTTSSSSSEEHGYFSNRNDALKRSRDYRIQDSDEEDDVCCSSETKSDLAAIDNSELVAFSRAPKMGRLEDHPGLRRRMKLMGSFISYQESTAAVTGGSNRNASEVIRRISNLNREAA